MTKSFRKAIKALRATIRFIEPSQFFYNRPGTSSCDAYYNNNPAPSVNPSSCNFLLSAKVFSSYLRAKAHTRKKSIVLLRVTARLLGLNNYYVGSNGYYSLILKLAPPKDYKFQLNLI